ncbi:MAG TPA: adenylate/guanylate cyclase domain-containing protein [Chitinophagaceae bacterium]|nr:adenylate/guanylate cyclase domain-containing protein [Chitinophagaceae bacterium]
MSDKQGNSFLLIFIFLLTIHTCSFSAPDTTTINQWLLKAYELENQHPDSSFLLAKKAWKVSVDNQYKKGMGSAAMRLGVLFNNKGQNDSALFYAQLAHQLRNEQRDFRGTSNVCLRLSYIYKETGKQDSAIYILFECIRMRQKIGDSVGIAEAYTDLGALYMSYNDASEAKNYFTKSIQLSESLNDSLSMQKAYSGMGTYYMQVSLYPKAISYFLKEAQLLQNTNSTADKARNCSNLAACYTETKQYNTARGYYQLALHLYDALNMRHEMCILLFNMGILFKYENNLDSASVYFEKSAVLAEETNDPERLAKALSGLAESAASNHDYASAYRYLSQFLSLRDSLYNTEKMKSVTEMQTKYKSDLQQQQIAHQNSELKYKQQQRNVFLIASALLLTLLWVTFRQHNKVKSEKKRSDKLLLNILPVEVAEELKETGSAVARQFDEVTVLFTDFVNFTSISQKMNPQQLVAEINVCFTAFDAISDEFHLEKIKTIGDAYLAAAGVPNKDTEHAIHAVQAAIAMVLWLKQNKPEFNIRVGLNSGPVVAGIVGKRKFAYDIWGDTVNTAARMEQQSESGQINLSGSTHELIQHQFPCIYRGKIQAKNKGEIDMYFIDQSKHT